MPALASPAPFYVEKRGVFFCRLALFLGIGLLPYACSKGGQPDQPSCATLSDLKDDGDAPLPKSLYAELRGAPVGGNIGPTIGVTLSGQGGVYAGMYTFGKCDAPGTYYAERLVLVGAAGKPVATATRVASGNGYSVAYENGSMAMASGSFTNSIAYAAASTPPPLKVQSVMPTAANARQGDRLNVQVSLSDEGGCGIRESRWWLTQATTPVKQAGEAAVIDGGNGTASLRVAPTLAAGSYVIEGQVTLRNGRVFLVHRALASDKTYKLYEASNNAIATDISGVVTAVMVTDAPDADRVLPTVLGTAARPAGPMRCEMVNLSMSLTDDRPLPAQLVKMILVSAENPSQKLATAMLGGTDVVSGNFVVPADAPFGLYYGYPEVVRDAAGNEARGTLQAGGKFLLTGSSQLWPAAAFIVENPTPLMKPNFEMRFPDAGTGGSDMAPALYPATLSALTVTAPRPPTKEGDTVAVEMRWTDLAKVL